MSENGGGGENLPKMVAFIFVFSLVMTIGVPIFILWTDAPDNEITVDQVDANLSIQQFTGNSMTSYVGWTLDGVYTAGNYLEQDRQGNNVWTSGSDVSDSWFVPGMEIAGKKAYPNGITTTTWNADKDNTLRKPYDPIRLNPDQKSAIHLAWQNESVKYTLLDTISQSDWLNHPVSSAVKTITHGSGTDNLYYWYFTGWRYQFSPVAPIQADNLVTDEVKLNIVWYANPDKLYDEAIEGGFLIYSEDASGYVAYIDSITLSDIISNYDASTGYATKYSFNFNGNIVYVFIKFDQGITETMSAQQAFSEGHWTVQFASPIVALMDYTADGAIKNFNVTGGEILDVLNSMLTPWDSQDYLPFPLNYVVFVIYVFGSFVLALFGLRIISAIIP